MHSRGNIDYNTWLGPLLIRQAETAAAALGRLLPEADADIRRRAKELLRDLEALDQQLRDLSVRSPDSLCWPRIRCTLTWRGATTGLCCWSTGNRTSDPDAQWAAFDALRARHPGTLMSWEEETLPAVQPLQKRSVRPVVFQTCGNRPPAGDYLQAMRRNLDELRAALASQ